MPEIRNETGSLWPLGEERPAIVDRLGKLRDASGLVRDIDVEAIERLAGIDPEGLPLVEGSVHLGVPLAGIDKFLAIGLNYTDHAVNRRQTGALTQI